MAPSYQSGTSPINKFPSPCNHATPRSGPARQAYETDAAFGNQDPVRFIDDTASVLRVQEIKNINGHEPVE